MCVQRPNGIRFIRLHVPWPILSREAELQKIKVAVKKVSGFPLAKWWFRSTRLTCLFYFWWHIPKAEIPRLQIHDLYLVKSVRSNCVSLVQSCELRKRTGIAGIWDSIVTKLNTPFQPDIPDVDTHKDSETRIHFKTLKHPFIRDKLHLWVSTFSFYLTRTHTRWHQYSEGWNSCNTFIPHVSVILLLKAIFQFFAGTTSDLQKHYLTMPHAAE